MEKMLVVDTALTEKSKEFFFSFFFKRNMEKIWKVN